MKLNSDQLQGHLQKNLLPLYLISGDVPLLVQETQELLRTKGQASGYTDRQIFTVETGFDWDKFFNEIYHLSLFSTQRMIELRFPTGKPNESATKILQEIASDFPKDVLLVITTNKLETSTQNSQWFKSLEKIGAVIQIWPIELSQMPRWLSDRLSRAGFQATNDAIQFLLAHTEGNLTAAKQEIEKLQLLYEPGKLNLEQIEYAISDNARFDIFSLSDCCLQGDSKRAVRILNTLKLEGTEPTLILWSLVRELRTLISLRIAVQQKKSIDEALFAERVWEKRKPFFRKSVNRYSVAEWKKILVHASQIDRIIKGISSGNLWDELLDLTLSMTGARLWTR